MAEKRPDIPEGYLGPQSKFQEFGLSTLSHTTPEINLSDNQLEVQINTAKPVKLTSNLIHCSSLKEHPEFVFTQTKDAVVTLMVSLPESGYYKLQLYALPAGDENKTLPGVFNYLINCTRAVNAVYAFPKQYAQWKEGCYLYEPKVLHRDSKLNNINFKVIIPSAKNVAVVAEGEWFHLDQKPNNTWEGVISSLDKHRGKDAKITVNACYGDDETKFSTLLEFRV